MTYKVTIQVDMDVPGIIDTWDDSTIINAIFGTGKGMR